jgi:16S rRNA G966 N2-methylase RsmD
MTGVHPAAQMFPMMPDDQLRVLADDIKANGLREPLILDHDGRLLDGRNRLAACRLAGVEPRYATIAVSDAVAFVLSLNLHRRHLTTGQRALLALRVEAAYTVEAKERQGTRTDLGRDFGTDSSQSLAGDVQSRKSATRAGAAVNVSGTSVKTARKLVDTAPDLAAKVECGALPLERAARIQRDREAETARIADAKRHAAAAPLELVTDLRLGDFRDVLSDVTGVDAIITDPPYPHEYLPLLADLAVFADRVLKPDGVLVVLMGQTHLPEVYRLLGGHRPYRWTGCYLTPGGAYVSHGRRVSSNWKPLLVYGSGPRFADTFTAAGGGAQAKDLHLWGQDYSAFHDIVERFTEPGQLVCDPFAGAGTTMLAARATGRHSVGAELDPMHHATAAARLA